MVVYVYLHGFNEIQSFVTNIYNANYGNIEISFKPEYEKASFPYLLKNKLISKAIDYGGIEWSIYGVGKGFDNQIGGGEPINYKVLIYGYNYNEINIQAEKIKQKLLKHPRIQKVDITGKFNWYSRNKYYYKIEINKKNIQKYKVDNREIYNQIIQLTKNNYPDINFIFNNENRFLKIRTIQAGNFDIWKLNNFELQINTLKIKLNDIVEITKEKLTDNITKENQQYIRTLIFEYMGSSRFGDKFVKQEVENANNSLPIGYNVEMQDLSWIIMLKKTKNQYWYILLIIFLIFLITSILFESFKLPVAILFMIPITFIGVFLTFYLFKIPFDKGGFASFILLSGITVNSAIFIVNDFKQNKNRNLKNYIKSFNHKIIPILLTIFSTALGLLPFIILDEKSPFWYSLAAGTIGGLIFSMIALFIYLPVILLTKVKY